MSALPTLTQIAGQHMKEYELYYKQVNPSGTATIGAQEAASFLKRSNLNDHILHKVWGTADCNSQGFLDKQGFFVALKLIALAQNSLDISISNLTVPSLPPKLVESPRPLAPPPSDANNWLIKAVEKKRYDGIFETLHPVNNYVSGDKVKPVLMNSKLPVDVLGRVWTMSDIDQDGQLDRDEFAVAMHLVYRALDGESVPNVLPPSLIPPSKRQNIVASSTVASSSVASSSYSPRSSVATSSSSVAVIQWVVSPTEKAKYDSMFVHADTNHDGLVSGPEVKKIFIQSGLPQPVLAHIWGLCDIRKTGQLNAEQFALAMHLISLKRAGADPPAQLTPEMIPPTMREKDEINNLSSNLAALQAKDFAAIKELDQINQEIEKLGREKVSLQQEIEQTEDAIRKRKTEIEDLQTEIGKHEKSTQELQKQRTDAQEQLSNVDKEKAKCEEMLAEVKQSCEDEKQTIANLRLQINTQDSTLKDQEKEFAAARKELNQLREEETKLEQQAQAGKSQLDQIKKSLQSTKNEISQMKTKISKLTEENQSLNASINQYSAMTNTINSSSTSSTPVPIGEGLGSVPENLEATFSHSDVDQISARATAGSSPVSSISGFSIGSGRVDDANDEDFKDIDPFKPKADPFSGNESENHDPFNTEDPFKQDPFKTVSFAEDPFAGDPFHEKDPFPSQQEKHEGDDDPFQSDPFKPVATSASPSSSTSDTPVNRPSGAVTDPFSSLDPFGSGAFTAPSKVSSADPFSAADPFAPIASPKTSVSSKKSSTSSNGQQNSSADPFFGGSSNQSAWSDPFGSGHVDPFSDSTDSKPSAPGDAWAAFGDAKKAEKSDEDKQLERALKESIESEKARQKRIQNSSEKEVMDVAKALKQSVESSSEA